MDEMKRFFCSKDCPDACHMLAEATPEGLKIKPLPERFTEKAFVCKKLKDFYSREITHNSASSLVIDRNGSGEKINTEEAVERLASLIKRRKNILFYRGSGSLSYYMGYWDKLLSNFENIWFVDGSPCDESGIRAHIEDFGVCMNPPVENLERTKSIILFGKNALVTSPHLFVYLKTLKESGKTIIYIDPIRSQTASIADIYIQINPATDGLLSYLLLARMSMVPETEEEKQLMNLTGVTEKELNIIQDHLLRAETGIIEGIGMQRYSNGKNLIQWINRLAYRTANTEFLYYSRSSKEGILPPVAVTRKNRISISELSRALKVRFFDAAIIVAANPVVTFPENSVWESSLKEMETAVIDTNFTETARCASLFVRSGGMFAQEDVQGSYFFNKTHKRERLIENLPSDKELIEKLAKKLSVVMPIPPLDEVTVESPKKMRTFSGQQIKLKKPFTEKGARIITLSHINYLNSQTEKVETEEIYLSPQLADRWKIKEGEIHAFSNKTGEEKLICRISDRVSGNTAFGYKNRSKTFNRLTESLPTDAKHAFSYYDCFITKKGG